jgi:hypothetical protein
MIANLSFSENFSMLPTLTRGTMAGLTTFGASILYEGAKATPKKNQKGFLFLKES